MFKFTLKGQALSNQHIYKQRGHIKFMIKEAKELKESYIEQIEQQMLEGLQTTFKDKLLSLTINLYHGTLLKRDIDNYGKLILDSMNGIIFDDDNQIQELHIYRHIDKGNPRSECEINIL